MTGLAVALLFLAPPGVEPVPGLAACERENVERNLRWALARERAGVSPKPRVGVFADAGVWHAGARVVVDTLESDGVPCRVLDRSLLTADVLGKLDSLVLPGGWAPYQWAAAGPGGLAAVKAYARGGGRVLGVCAGAYLLSKVVEYDGKTYPYPLALFDGTAAGPVPGLAPYPTTGRVIVEPTAAGVKRGLPKRECDYSGGPCFRGGTGAEVLARYPDGSAAAVRRAVGKGEVVLIGAHPEQRPGAAAYLKALLTEPRP